MIDRFTKEEFQAVLPKVNGKPVWLSLGLQNGEECYLIPCGSEGRIFIYVRSSIDGSGIAADTGEDSIRCWLTEGLSGKPLGSKMSRWIARTPGWSDRLLETLRSLWKLGRQLRPCAACGGQTLALKVKAGANKDRWFRKCGACGEFQDWIDPKYFQSQP